MMSKIFFLSCRFILAFGLLFMQLPLETWGKGPMMSPLQWLVRKEKLTRGEKIVEFRVDLNDDKELDLFLTPETQLGHQGSQFHIFLGLGPQKGYRYLNQVFLHPDHLEILSTKHYGLKDLKVYLTKANGRGEVLYYHFDQKRYELGHKAEIESVDYDKFMAPDELQEVKRPIPEEAFKRVTKKIKKK